MREIAWLIMHNAEGEIVGVFDFATVSGFMSASKGAETLLFLRNDERPMCLPTPFANTRRAWAEYAEYKEKKL